MNMFEVHGSGSFKDDGYVPLSFWKTFYSGYRCRYH